MNDEKRADSDSWPEEELLPEIKGLDGPPPPSAVIELGSDIGSGLEPPTPEPPPPEATQGSGGFPSPGDIDAIFAGEPIPRSATSPREEPPQTQAGPLGEDLDTALPEPGLIPPGGIHLRPFGGEGNSASDEEEIPTLGQLPREQPPDEDWDQDEEGAFGFPAGEQRPPRGGRDRGGQRQERGGRTNRVEPPRGAQGEGGERRPEQSGPVRPPSQSWWRRNSSKLIGAGIAVGVTAILIIVLLVVIPKGQQGDHPISPLAKKPGSSAASKSDKENLTEDRTGWFISPGEYVWENKTDGWVTTVKVWPVNYEEIEKDGTQTVLDDPTGAKAYVRSARDLLPEVSLPEMEIETNGTAAGFNWEVYQRRRQILEEGPVSITDRAAARVARGRECYGNPEMWAMLDPRLKSAEGRLDKIEDWQKQTDTRLTNLEGKVDQGFQSLATKLGEISTKLEPSAPSADPVAPSAPSLPSVEPPS